MIFKYVSFNIDHKMIDKEGKVKKFFKYFNGQWIYNCFNLWQIYNTPAGFSTSQSPIESFNKEVKLTFTDYTKLSVYECLSALMVTIIEYYSKNQ